MLGVGIKETFPHTFPYNYIGKADIFKRSQLKFTIFKFHLIRKSPRWCVFTQPWGCIAVTNQVNVSDKICRYKLYTLQQAL